MLYLALPLATARAPFLAAACGSRGTGPPHSPRSPPPQQLRPPPQPPLPIWSGLGTAGLRQSPNAEDCLLTTRDRGPWCCSMTAPFSPAPWAGTVKWSDVTAGGNPERLVGEVQMKPWLFFKPWNRWSRLARSCWQLRCSSIRRGTFQQRSSLRRQQDHHPQHPDHVLASGVTWTASMALTTTWSNKDIVARPRSCRMDQ